MIRQQLTESKNMKNKLRKMQKSISYHKSKNMKKQRANVKAEKIVNNFSLMYCIFFYTKQLTQSEHLG